MRRGRALRSMLFTAFCAVSALAQAQEIISTPAPEFERAATRVGSLRSAVRLYDDFSAEAGTVGGYPDQARWLQAKDVALVADAAAPSLPTAALLRMKPEPELSGRLSSQTLDLSDVAGAKLSLWAFPASRGAAGQLMVHWQTDERTEKLLEIDSAGFDNGAYELFVAALPVAALRSGLRLIITGAGETDWYLDDVCLVAAGVTLTVRSRPDEAAEIAVFPPDVEERTGGRPDFARYYERAVAVALAAPPRSGRLTFERWLVDGKCEASPDGRLTHYLADDTVAIAEYALLGDMNGDGRLDRFDLDEFVLAMVDAEEYAERHPELDRLRRGDLNGDGVIDRSDIDPFVAALLSPDTQDRNPEHR